MTLLVTADRFTAITGAGQYDKPAIEAALEEAQELLEDALDRPLASAQRTERLQPTRDGYVWPRAVPITVATGYTIDGYGLVGPFGPAWPDESGLVTVTTTGGWVERTANPDATNRLPAYIERDLAYAALAILQTQPDDEGRDQLAPTFIAGATSVRLGDAAVTFGPDGPPRPEAAVQWSRRTLRWRHRTILGAPC